MAIPHSKPGEVIDIRPLGQALAAARTTTLIKTEALEVIRLVFHKDKQIHSHKVDGEITVQCLEGRVRFQAGDEAHELGPGQMLYLAGGTPHSVQGIDDGSLLLTILLR